MLKLIIIGGKGKKIWDMGSKEQYCNIKKSVPIEKKLIGSNSHHGTLGVSEMSKGRVLNFVFKQSRVKES